MADSLEIVIENGEETTYSGVDNNKKTGYSHQLTLVVPEQEKEVNIEALFLPEVKKKYLLGTDFLREYGVILDSTHIYLFNQ